MDVALFYFYFIIVIYIQTNISVTRDDFYDYSKAQLLKEQFMTYNTSIIYPHWSDPKNKIIQVVNSGVIRLSGLDGDNTLDVLVFATAIPIADQDSEIFWQRFENITGKINIKLNEDLAAIHVDKFTPQEVFIATWINVQFLRNRRSTFQVVLTTDSSTTYAIILVDKLEHEQKMVFFPEVDLRFAYKDGTKFKRSNFLFEESQVKTGTMETSTAAEQNSNSNLAGRWILNLTADPQKQNDTEIGPSVAPPVTASQVQNLTGISMKGLFRFTTLSLNGNTLTNGKGVDEISTILTKKYADVRYNELNEAINEWVINIYQGISGGIVKVNILDYRTGSLIFDYSVEIKNSTKLCQSSQLASVCLPEIQEEVKDKIKNDGVNSKQLSATVDVSTIEISGIFEYGQEQPIMCARLPADNNSLSFIEYITRNTTLTRNFDECLESNGSFCDVNAYCLNYPNQLSYGCLCKNGYNGNGFAGNCKKDSTKESSNNNLTIAIGVVAAVLIVLIFAGFYYAYYRRKKTRRIERSYSGGQHRRRDFTVKKKKRILRSKNCNEVVY